MPMGLLYASCQDTRRSPLRPAPHEQAANERHSCLSDSRLGRRQAAITTRRVRAPALAVGCRKAGLWNRRAAAVVAWDAHILRDRRPASHWPAPWVVGTRQGGAPRARCARGGPRTAAGRVQTLPSMNVGSKGLRTRMPETGRQTSGRASGWPGIKATGRSAGRSSIIGRVHGERSLRLERRTARRSMRTQHVMANFRNRCAHPLLNALAAHVSDHHPGGWGAKTRPTCRAAL